MKKKRVNDNAVFKHIAFESVCFFFPFDVAKIENVRCIEVLKYENKFSKSEIYSCAVTEMT